VVGRGSDEGGSFFDEFQKRRDEVKAARGSFIWGNGGHKSNILNLSSISGHGRDGGHQNPHVVTGRSLSTKDVSFSAGLKLSTETVEER